MSPLSVSPRLQSRVSVHVPSCYMNLRQYLRVNSSILGRAGDHSSRRYPYRLRGVVARPTAPARRCPPRSVRCAIEIPRRGEIARCRRHASWSLGCSDDSVPRGQRERPRALNALSVKVTRTLDSPVRPAGPAGISRISSVPYRSKYGLFSMPKRPTPLLRSHAVPERAGDIETTLRTHRHRQSSPHLPPMTPLNATQHAASATPGQQT